MNYVITILHFYNYSQVLLFVSLIFIFLNLQ
jgi:hypothetical protein